MAGGKLPAPILMPFSFDDFVIGVGGGELDNSDNPIHWGGAGESPYVNVTAAANDLVTLSAESYSSYNTTFSSTTGSAAIVAGVASILKEEVNNYSYEDIRYVLQNSAIDIEDPGKDDKTGEGWLDAQAALSYVQNNDFVRKSVPKNEIATISDTQDNSYTYKLDEDIAIDICPGSEPGLSSTNSKVDGWINTFKGRISFEYKFSSSPDVWFRNSSSGTDVNPLYFGSGLYQFYEPYNKDLTITSIDEHGFEFEMRYWHLEGYDSGLNLVCIGDVPNLNTIQIDYTVAGDETNIPAGTPSAPTNLAVTNLGQTGSFSAPQLNWDDNSEPNIDHYNVYRKIIDIDNVAQEIASVSSSAYTDWSINQIQSGGNDITYFVQAENTSNLKSGNSNIAMVHGESMIQLRVSEPDDLPTDFSLKSNYPNPFNPSSTIGYELPERSEVTLSIYNMLGQRVAILIDGEIQPGRHNAVFDASALSSGNYIARFTAIGASGEMFEETMNMQLIK